MSWTRPLPRLHAITGGRARRGNDVAAALAGGGGHLRHRVAYLDTSAADAAEAGASAAAETAAATAGPPDEVEQGSQGSHIGPEPTGAGWTGWPVESGRATAAMKEARAYRGPAFEDAAEQAWSARVDAAVQGLDEVDAAGLDGWMQVHAASRVPHLLEARLVAAWESRPGTTIRIDTDTAAADPTSAAAEPLDADADADTAEGAHPAVGAVSDVEVDVWD